MVPQKAVQLRDARGDILIADLVDHIDVLACMQMVQTQAVLLKGAAGNRLYAGRDIVGVGRSAGAKEHQEEGAKYRAASQTAKLHEKSLRMKNGDSQIAIGIWACSSPKYTWPVSTSLRPPRSGCV